MLAVFSARQLAQGYNFTHNPCIYEEFLCLFQVIGNEHMTPSLIDPQIPNFQNGCFFFFFISGVTLVVLLAAKFCGLWHITHLVLGRLLGIICGVCPLAAQDNGLSLRLTLTSW